jgi:hypothetical protein
VFLKSLVDAFRYSRGFTPLESQLIEAVASGLGDSASRLLRAQVADDNRVHRYGGSVDCYVKHWGKLRRNTAHDFLNRSPELRFATVTFRCTTQRKRLKAEFFAVKGHFFEILFSKPVKHIASPVDIERVSIDADPMTTSSARPERKETAIQFTGWLAQWAELHKAKKAYEPLEPEAQSRLLSGIDARLPSDYLDIIQQTEGLDFEDCGVMGLSEIYKIAGDDANYYRLAELDGFGMLAVRSKSSNGSVAYLGYDHERGEFASLREAMESYFAGDVARLS